MRALRAAWDYGVLVLGLAGFVVVTLTWAVFALPLLLVLPRARGRRVGRWGAMWGFRTYLCFLELIGAVRLDVSELDALRGAGPLVVAPNHPGLLDAVLMVSRMPDAVCVMKSALLGNLLLGPAARLARYVKNDSLIRLSTEACAELRAGGQLLLFPEGTRTVGGVVGPFTDAVAAISRRAQVPVQAVFIETDARVLGKGQSLFARPQLPLAFRITLGRRFEPPRDARRFTAELHAYFTRELDARAASRAGAPLPEALEEIPPVRG